SSGRICTGVKPARWMTRQNRLLGLTKCRPAAAAVAPGLMPQKMTDRSLARMSGSPLLTTFLIAAPRSPAGLALLARVQADDHGRLGKREAAATAVGRDVEPALDRRHGHSAVGQLLGDGRGVDRLRVRHRDPDIDEHVMRRLAEHPHEAEARMADR